jgi:hypothetical protein
MFLGICFALQKAQGSRVSDPAENHHWLFRINDDELHRSVSAYAGLKQKPFENRRSLSICQAVSKGNCSYATWEGVGPTQSTAHDSTVTGKGGCGRVVSWGTMLQARKSGVRVPMRSLHFLNWPNPSSRTMVPRSTQILTGWVSGIFMAGKTRPARKADNLIAICEPNV